MRNFFKKIPKLYFMISYGPFYPSHKFLFFAFSKLYWKDKFNTPRIEECPYIGFFIKEKFYSLRVGSDSWWEQRIWWKIYCKDDYKKAKETWPWLDTKNKSTWKV